MEIGTMDNTLLQEHDAGTEQATGVGMALTLSVARPWMAVAWFFASRSGEATSEGGHMIVPSIGQAMSSSSISTVSAPVMRSGEAHIVPST